MFDTIKIDELTDLKITESKYWDLLHFMLDNAELSYNGEYLRFDDEKLSTAISLICPLLYEDTLQELKENKNGTDKD